MVVNDAVLLVVVVVVLVGRGECFQPHFLPFGRFVTNKYTLSSIRRRRSRLTLLALLGFSWSEILGVVVVVVVLLFVAASAACFLDIVVVVVVVVVIDSNFVVHAKGSRRDNQETQDVVGTLVGNVENKGNDQRQHPWE